MKSRLAELGCKPASHRPYLERGELPDLGPISARSPNPTVVTHQSLSPKKASRYATHFRPIPVPFSSSPNHLGLLFKLGPHTGNPLIPLNPPSPRPKAARLITLHVHDSRSPGDGHFIRRHLRLDGDSKSSVCVQLPRTRPIPFADVKLAAVRVRLVWHCQ